MAILRSRFALFNDWNFNNVPGLSVYALDLPGQAKRTLNIFAVARRNARKVSSAYYQENTLAIGVYIQASSREALEQAVDTLYQNIQGQEGSLVVPKSGAVRLYTATYAGSQVNNGVQNTTSPSGNTADLTLMFECSDSYGYDTNYTLIRQSTGLTSNLVATQFTQGGGADTQVPFFEVQYTAAPTGATNGTLTIGNTDTGQAISITRTFSQYDLVQIDCRNKTVQVNGADVDFTGAFPEFSPSNVGGVNTPRSFYVQDNFTTRTYRLLACVYNRYS